MIIALLVIMFIVLVVLYNVIDKIKENDKYYLKCIKLMNDMDVTLLDKINDLEKIVEELEAVIDATNIKADEIKAGTIPKTCSIDGKCNY